MPSPLVKFLTAYAEAHECLLEYIDGQIADGDDSDEARDMRTLLEHMIVTDAAAQLVIEGAKP